MKKVSLFSAVLAAGLMFPLAGAAQQPAPEAAAQREAHSERRQRPQLTEAQRDAMRTLHDEQRTAREMSRTDLRELHVELRKALSAAQIDSARVNELKGQIAQKQAAVTAARIDQRAKVAALLTPGQRQTMGERGERRLERGPRGKDGMRGRRGAAGMHGQMMRQRGGGSAGRNDAQLRQRIEKLERELEELRKKIG